MKNGFYKETKWQTVIERFLDSEEKVYRMTFKDEKEALNRANSLRTHLKKTRRGTIKVKQTGKEVDMIYTV